MLTTEVVDPGSLTKIEHKIILKMATWRYAPGLSEQSQFGYTFIVLKDESKIKGLCVVDLSPPSQLCEIKLCFLDPSINMMEGYQLLFSHVYLLAKENYFPLLSIKYANNVDNDLLKQFLDRDGWRPSRDWLKQYFFVAKEFHPKWINWKLPLRSDLSVITWREMTPQLLSSIKATVQAGGVPDYLTPFYWEEYLQELNTLILLKENRAIGWSVTHTFPDSPNTIEYSSLFVHPLYRSYGYAIHLLAESIRLQLASEIKYALFNLGLKESSKSWQRFVERHLQPYAEKITTVVRQDRFL